MSLSGPQLTEHQQQETPWRSKTLCHHLVVDDAASAIDLRQGLAAQITGRASPVV